MPAKLVILAGPRCGETVSLDSAQTSIGRDARNHLNIPDHLMSRRHCVVELLDGQATLRDVGSANGTYVNGMPVRERILAHGDRIRVGDSVFLFLHAGAEAPPPHADADEHAGHRTFDLVRRLTNVPNDHRDRDLRAQRRAGARGVSLPCAPRRA